MATITGAPTLDDAGGRPAYARLGVVGLGLIAAAMALLAGAFAATGSDQLVAALAILGVVAVIAALAWRYGTWAKVIAIVCSVLIGVAFMPLLIVGVAYPASPTDFLPGLFLPLGVVLGIGGSAAAIRHRRELIVHAKPTERRIMQGVLILLLAAVAVSTVSALVSRSTVDLADGGVPVDMRGFAFPERIEAHVGDQLVVHNSDATVHDFAVPHLDLKTLVLPGNDGVIDLADADEGTYIVYCTLHSNTSNPDPTTAGMATTLVVAAP